jgi:mRNA-degrading endonuclease toxin of MazEF toxin-antitoxin module
MSPGEIHLAIFPYGGTIGAKPRPVLLLTGPLGSVPEVLAAYMTSIIPASFLPTDILIDPSLPRHTGTGLKQKSLLRLHKLATLHDTDLLRRLGQVSASTWNENEVEAKLRLLLKLP